MEPNTHADQENQQPTDAPSSENVEQHALQQWWVAYTCPEKEFLHLSENGQLSLNAWKNLPEKLVAQLDIKQAEAQIEALRTKFSEVENKVSDFKAEWEAQEDKGKLNGKFCRLHDYLKQVKTIGNFAAIDEQINDWQATLQTVTQAHREEKEKLVSQAEALSSRTEWKETTQKIKELTEAWKNTGALDKDENEELYHRFDKAKNHFFEEKRKAHEQLEEEMLQNQDLKLELVNKAEDAATSEDWKKTTELYRALMDEWKKIGRTFHEKNEEYWQRFIKAKNLFFDRKKENFLHIQEEQEQNLILKQQLIDKAEALKDSEEWNKTASAYAEIMEEWKKVGRVPLEKANVIWEQLSAAKDYFFERKRVHFQTVKVNLDDNLALKTALVNRAEKLQDSIMWRETTEELNEMMDEWKRIGAVPRAYSQQLWERFLQARKHFFGRKDADRDKRKARVAIQKEIHNKQAAQSVINYEENLQEEKNRLQDFKEALQNITPGPKAEELKQHLENLIEQTEQRVLRMTQKLEQLRNKQKPQTSAEDPEQTETEEENNDKK